MIQKKCYDKKNTYKKRKKMTGETDLLEKKTRLEHDEL